MKMNRLLRIHDRRTDIRPIDETMHRWNRLHGLIMLAAAVPFLSFRSIVPIFLAGSSSFFVFITVSWTAVKDLKPVFGWANMVTLLRLTILLTASLFYRFLPGTHIASILLSLVLLDWFDGYLARRLNQRTCFGAHFDRETDALYVCISGCMLYLSERAPVWILLPAFLRYAFIVTVRLVNLHGLRERRTLFGPPAAVIMFLSLAAAFVLPQIPSLILLSCSSILIIGSFLYSFMLLLAEKRILRSENRRR